MWPPTIPVSGAPSYLGLTLGHLLGQVNYLASGSPQTPVQDWGGAIPWSLCSVLIYSLFLNSHYCYEHLCGYEKEF